MSSYAHGFQKTGLSILDGVDARQQLDDELRYTTLLEMTGWMANNLRFGCAKCAPFLTRQKMPLQPPNHQMIVSGSDQLKPQAIRERSIAR